MINLAQIKRAMYPQPLKTPEPKKLPEIRVVLDASSGQGRAIIERMNEAFDKFMKAKAERDRR